MTCSEPPQPHQKDFSNCDSFQLLHTKLSGMTGRWQHQSPPSHVCPVTRLGQQSCEGCFLSQRPIPQYEGSKSTCVTSCRQLGASSKMFAAGRDLEMFLSPVAHDIPNLQAYHSGLFAFLMAFLEHPVHAGCCYSNTLTVSC